MSRPGNNQPCPCGSGKKYKKCCSGKDQREPYTCSFCGAKEGDVEGEEVVLVDGDEERPGWACSECVSKRRKSGEAFLPILATLAAAGFGQRRLP